MPTNKKEEFIFALVMCFLMVLGMSTYNSLLHHTFSIGGLLKGGVVGFFVAFILDTLIVGSIAKKIAFSLPINKEKKRHMILAISFFMVLGMVTSMSLFGLIIEEGVAQNMGRAYVQAWKMNMIAALPYQLLIVGPFSRFILKGIQKSEKIK